MEKNENIEKDFFDNKEKSDEEIKKDLIEWYKNHKKYFRRDYKINDSYSKEKDPDGNVSRERFREVFEDFKVDARHLLFSDSLRTTYAIRHEELIVNIDKEQKLVDDYNNYCKDHTEDEVRKHFTTAELSDINNARTQIIPMLMMELETLSSAICSNYTTYNHCIRVVAWELDDIMKYLKVTKEELN